MVRAPKFSAFFPLLLACLATYFLRADDSDLDTYTDPEKAGPDYAVQGEYLGPLTLDEEDLYAAQVVALGDGKFRLVGYKGGLPGEGWNRGQDRVTVEGERSGSNVEFVADTWSSRIVNGEMVVLDSSGNKLGTLTKVERKSDTLGAKPPQGAIVLFNGAGTDQFANGRMTDEGLLLADAASKTKWQDHTLHVEFRTPFMPHARGQARGNSGVYVQGRYEVQILDSFGLEGEDNECGGIYSFAKPKVNMCYPPLAWQTYDIDFTPARYDASGKKIRNARITVRHNGVVIHDDLELPRHSPGYLEEGPEPGPLYLQGHGNPVVYRNVWVVPKEPAQPGRGD